MDRLELLVRLTTTDNPRVISVAADTKTKLNAEDQTTLEQTLTCMKQMGKEMDKSMEALKS
jgi:hypothetical protein